METFMQFSIGVLCLALTYKLFGVWNVNFNHSGTSTQIHKYDTPTAGKGE